MLISQFFVHLILKIIKNQLTKAFADSCQLHQLRRPDDVVWDAVRDGVDEAPPLLGLSAFTFFLMMLSHTGGKLYLPPSLLRLGLRALMYMASYSSLKPSGFCCKNFSVLQLHGMFGGDQRGYVWKPLRLSS